MTGTDRVQPGRDGEQAAPLAGPDGSVWERVPSGVLLLVLWLAALVGAVALGLWPIIATFGGSTIASPACTASGGRSLRSSVKVPSTT